MDVKCYLLSPVDKIQVNLRRYISSSDEKCSLSLGFHNAQFFLGNFDFPVAKDGDSENWIEFENSLRPPNDDTRWPSKCDCGRLFSNDSTYQMFTHRLYSGHPNGELYTLRDASPGALWYATWYKYTKDNVTLYGCDWDNATTAPLMCKVLDNTDWNIDSRCSNCTLPNDRTHRCWIRHGDPPNIHVDKNGFTCSAGAGSIAAPNWHGFLHNGELTQA